MELYINSPAYFTNMYGIDDEVYKHGFGNGMGMCMEGWPKRAIDWFERMEKEQL